MSTKPLTIVAHVKAKPGREAEMRQELIALIAPSRKDEGCLNYDLHQDAVNPAAFLLHENWASKELLDKHLATPHVQQALGRLGELAAEPPQITLWNKIG